MDLYFAFLAPKGYNAHTAHRRFEKIIITFQETGGFIMKGKKTNRRRFLRGTMATVVGVGSFPYLIPSTALGKAGDVPPSERIAVGSIGVGGMGTNNMRAFLTQPDVQVVAVCDVAKASNEYGHWYKKGWQGGFHTTRTDASTRSGSAWIIPAGRRPT